MKQLVFTCFISILLFRVCYSQEASLVLPIGHTYDVMTATISNDGKFLITCSGDQTVKIWDLKTTRLVKNFVSGVFRPSSAFLSDDNTRIIVGGLYGAPEVWDSRTGKKLFTLKHHLYGGDAKAFFLPGSKKILTIGEWSYDAAIWDAVTGKLLVSHRPSNSQKKIETYRTSFDGTIIMGISEDSTVSLWSPLPDLDLTRLNNLLRGPLTHCDLSWNGALLAVRHPSGKIEIFNVKTGSTQSTIDTTDQGVESLLLSNDEKYLLIGRGDRIDLLDSKNGNLVTSKLLPSIKSLSHDPSGSILACITKQDQIRFLQAKTLAQTNMYQASTAILKTEFSPNGSRIAIQLANDSLIILDTKNAKVLTSISNIRTGTLSDKLMGMNEMTKSFQFSPDSRNISMIGKDGSTYIWREVENNLVPLFHKTNPVSKIRISSDHARIVTRHNDGALKLWNATNGKLITNLTGHKGYVFDITFSPDGKKIVTCSSDSKANIWNTQTGKLLSSLEGHEAGVTSAYFSMDGLKIITSSQDKTIKVWNTSNGNLMFSTPKLKGIVVDANFSPDGNFFFSLEAEDTIARIWDANTVKLVHELKGHIDEINEVKFSPDGSKVLTGSDDEDIILWDIKSGSKLHTLTHTASGDDNFTVWGATFSSDGTKIISYGSASWIYVWDIITGKELHRIKAGYQNHSGYFTQDGSYIVFAGSSSDIDIFNAISGKLRFRLSAHSGSVSSIDLTKDGKILLSAGMDNTCKVWDVESGTLLLSFIAVDSSDYLLIDAQNRYDGTDAARKLLYFNCGLETVDLDQVKDRLWVPNLGERIMKGDSINASGVSDLSICGLTPEIEEIKDQKDVFHFTILPRRGGLGESALYVNGIEVQRYKKEQLRKNAGSYELIIGKQELNNYFIRGQENPVIVKAWTADNTISSRGLIIKEDKSDIKGTAPNLYAVLVGVSDYKGDELDLKYAAKDAAYMSAAISNASRKLLNTDGNEHVFTYNLTTSNDRYLLPEKNSIRKTLEEIGKKASSNDILLIFFAGHGVMEGKDKKQFYFLTADASKSSAVDAIADVGISTNELTEWIKPANIKAQKRILIFDACNSGQAIRDFVQLGKPEQGYIAARSDEKGQQIKAIEKLNNQSGLIILAASASDQNAYEMGRYSQGLLTYSLLKVMKQQPEILENGKYLDVSNWLNAAKKMVSTLAEGTGARQEPQLNSNNNFNIGLIDEEVRNKIILSAEKPLFARSNFQNTDTKIDNLKFRSAIDKELMNISSRGINADITYSADYEGADAFSLTGDYKINSDTVTVNVLLVKGGTEVKHNYEVKGKITELNSLISNITSSALDWLKNNK